MALVFDPVDLLDRRAVFIGRLRKQARFRDAENQLAQAIGRAANQGLRVV
jgi:hypothetical protein